VIGPGGASLHGCDSEDEDGVETVGKAGVRTEGDDATRTDPERREPQSVNGGGEGTVPRQELGVKARFVY
jgi:hypothetical protein